MVMDDGNEDFLNDFYNTAQGIRNRVVQRVDADNQPSRQALRAAGYTGRIPLLHRGRLQDPAMARAYTMAHDHDWHVKFGPRFGLAPYPAFLSRFGLTAGWAPLFEGQSLTVQGEVFQTLLRVQKVFNLKAHQWKNAMFTETQLRDGLLRMYALNGITSVANVEPRLLACFLFWHLTRDTFERLSVLPYFADGATQQALAFKVRYGAATLSSWQINPFAHYTLTEMETILNAGLNLTVERWDALNFLRAQVQIDMPIGKVLTYLKLPTALFNDLFATYQA